MSADFLDTNILVYSFDHSAPEKRSVSRELVAEALHGRGAVISYQVIQEFLNVATRKFESPMSTEEARLYLNNVLSPLCTVWPSRELYAAALEIAHDAGFGFYDALIVASAAEAGCPRLLTEDLQSGRSIRGVTIVNPYT